MSQAPRRTSSIIYGVLDLLMAGLYLFVIFHLAPSRSTGFTAIAVGASLIFALGGVGMLSGRAWGRRIALLACLLMLLAAGLLILLLLLSAAYLHGIYDGVGEAGAVIGILVAMVVFEAVGLLPGLQVAHLLRLRREESKA